MNDFSCMAWEPCILKHGPGYDDPWMEHIKYKLKKDPTYTEPKVNRREAWVYDSITKTIGHFRSLADASRTVGCDASHIRQSAVKGWTVKKTYACGFTREQLLHNIAELGLDK